MRLYDILQELDLIKREHMNFKLGNYCYDLNSLKPKIVDDDNRLIIFDLHKSNNYTDKLSFKALYSRDISIDFLFYTVVLEVGDKLYDFPEYVFEPKDTNYFSWILDTVYIPKNADFMTLNQLNRRVENMSKNIGIDLCNAELHIITSDGEDFKISPADIRFHIKHEGENLILGISAFQDCEF